MLITHRIVKCRNCQTEIEVLDDELDVGYIRCPECQFLFKTETVYIKTKYGYQKELLDSYEKEW